jgi:predicted MFS family arabinose efflux permease
MPVLGWAAQRVVGAPIPPRLRPLLASVFANFAGLSVFTIFFGPWLVNTVHASAGQASVAYLVAGVAGVFGGYAGGFASDRFGRRPVILAGAGTQTAVAAGLLLPGIGVATASVLLVVMSFAQPVRGVAQRAAVADTAPEDGREHAFAGYRLAVNVGALIGPLTGAALVGAGWTALHAGTVVLFALSLVLALRLPAAARRPHVPDGAPSRAFGVLRDPRLWGLLAATTGAWTVVCAYETVVPIALTQSHGVAPSTWGAVYALGPALVIVLQLRLSRWLGGVGMTVRLAVGVTLMGTAFLALFLGASLPVLVVLVIVFVLGDLVWGPASDEAAVAIAPVDRRGAYLGVVTTSIWLGGALAPGIGLPLRERYGESAVWTGVCLLAVASAALYVANGRTGRRAYADTSS